MSTSRRLLTFKLSATTVKTFDFVFQMGLNTSNTSQTNCVSALRLTYSHNEVSQKNVPKKRKGEKLSTPCFSSRFERTSFYFKCCAQSLLIQQFHFPFPSTHLNHHKGLLQKSLWNLSNISEFSDHKPFVLIEYIKYLTNTITFYVCIGTHFNI